MRRLTFTYSGTSRLIGRYRRVAVLLVATLLFMVGLAATPAQAATSPVVVSLTFDNEWANQMTAAQAMHAAGMPGTFYVISGWIGTSNFMSMSDLQTLVSWGDEIGGKTVDNTDLTAVTSAEAQRETCLGRDVLMGDGFTVTNFAYPFSNVNSTAESVVKTCGMNSGRDVGNINSLERGGCRFPDCPYAETIPPADPYDIRTPGAITTTHTVSNVENEISQAVNHGGGWLVYTFHHICVQGTSGCDPVYAW